MAWSLQDLIERRKDLEECLRHANASHGLLKEQCKNIKNEINNTKGAVLELDKLIEDEKA